MDIDVCTHLWMGCVVRVRVHLGCYLSLFIIGDGRGLGLGIFLGVFGIFLGISLLI